MLLRNANDAAHLLRSLVSASSSEVLAIAYLDGKGRVLKVNERRGSSDLVDVSLRDVVADGLGLGASAILVAHNHPSGNTAPSEDDLSVTRQLAGICEGIGIRLHDHLIFGGGRCCSMRALGLL